MRYNIGATFERDDVSRLIHELLNDKVRDMFEREEDYEFDKTMSKVTHVVDCDYDKQLFMLNYGSAFIFYGYLLQNNILRGVRVVELKNDRTSIMFSYAKVEDVCELSLMATENGLSENEVSAYMRSLIKSYLSELIDIIKLNINQLGELQYLIKFIVYLQSLSKMFGLPDTDRVNSVLDTVKQICDFDLSSKLNNAFVTLSLA